MSKGIVFSFEKNIMKKAQESRKFKFLSESRMNVPLYILIGILISVMPLFGSEYKNCLKVLIVQSQYNYPKFISERVAIDVGENLLLVYTDEPRLKYYNRKKPLETLYILKEIKSGYYVFHQDRLETAINRVRTGSPVYITNMALQLLQYSNLKHDVTRLWHFGDIALYRINSLGN